MITITTSCFIASSVDTYDFVFNEEVLVLLLRVDMYDFVFNEELDKVAPAVFGLVFILELDNVPLAVLSPLSYYFFYYYFLNCYILSAF